MNTKKENALRIIQDDVRQMSELILGQLRDLENILSSGQLSIENKKVEKFGKTERLIDELEVKISNDFINIICLHMPVASELRKIVTCYRLSINLERIGDVAWKIMKLLPELAGQPGVEQFVDEIHNMLIMTNNMVEKSILSFFNSDIDYAIWTLKNDDVIDKINNKMIKKLLKKDSPELRNSQTIVNFINIKTVVSSIERIADHSTNIAEASIYFLRGQDIRHLKKTDSELKSFNDASNNN